MPVQLTSHEIEQIQLIAEMLKKNLKVHPSTPALAEKAGMGERRFTIAFNQVTGNGVFTYVKNARMDKACKLLLEFKPIRYIARETGFRGKAAPSNFIKAFKRKYGETPANWRRRQLNGKLKR